MTRKNQITIPKWAWTANNVAWVVVWVLSGFNLLPGIPFL